MNSSIAIVIPVYNDWNSFLILLKELDLLAGILPAKLTIVAVDDGSTIPPPLSNLSVKNIASVELVSLFCNVGHQRAISIGLADAVLAKRFDLIAIMDADGEDSPAAISDLLTAQLKEPASIVVASRSKRSEGSLFRIFYVLYKMMFRMLTGQLIDYGNFCMMPFAAAERLSFMSESSCHFAAALCKSRLKLVRVPVNRQRRYADCSSMNFVSLVKHGFIAISVFWDIVQTRLFLFVCVISSFAFVIGIIAAFVRLFTGFATPGWATTVLGVAILMIFQSLTLLTVMIFGDLNRASSFSFVPALHAISYIRERKKLI